MSECWRLLQGSVVVTITIATAVWSQVDPNLMSIWILGYALWVVGSCLVCCGILLPHWRDQYQTPIILKFIYMGRGIWICASALVNWEAFATGGAFFWTLATLWSITMAGSMIFMTVANNYFIQGILGTAILLTAAIHQWAACVSTLAFLVMATQALDAARQTRVSEVKLRTKLIHQARTDSLTGLLNRVGLSEWFLNLPPTALGVMFIDLDRFKEVNDRLGHGAGDELLVQVAQRLAEEVSQRPNILVRLGGDEFLIVLPGCSLRDLLAIADTILLTLEKPFVLAAGQAYISASIGTANSEGQTDLEQLITDADDAMYRAKQTGRRRVVYSDELLRQDAQQRIGLESNLRQAVAKQQIIAWGQPIIDHQTAKISVVELLARWQLDQKYISPDLFIGIASNIGLTSAIAKLMVDQAQAYLQQWQNIPSLADTIISINIESQDLVGGLIVDYLEKLVFTAALDPAKLILEITERELIEAEVTARFQIDRLHTLGIQVAIDDFGAGYSSLQSVMMLPVDLLKFDRSLISAATRNQRMKNVLGAIVEMANGFEITVISEGIETAEDIEVMKSLNINLLQGYFYAQPMQADALISFATDFSSSFSI